MDAADAVVAWMRASLSLDSAAIAFALAELCATVSRASWLGRICAAASMAELVRAMVAFACAAISAACF